MKKLNRIRYNTMNSWNNSTAPAYNLKVYHVIDNELQHKVFELMETEDFYFEINEMIEDFNHENDYVWQAGFNGRSGGYLVLYKGGRDKKYLAEKDFNGGRIYISDRYGWKSYEEAKQAGLVDREITTRIFSYPGKSIDEKEVPGKVLRRFRKLAVDIVKSVEYMAKHCNVEEEEYTVTKTRKVIV